MKVSVSFIYTDIIMSLCIYYVLYLWYFYIYATQLSIRGKAGRSHNTGHKGRKRVNNLAAAAPITEKKIEERMRVIIGA